tara:strand:+ start:930 stop:2327 length:1398 start_codon:yes stop_codon:yes gene_type:complete
MDRNSYAPGLSGTDVGDQDIDPFTQIGVSGLNRSSNGYATIEEEWLSELRGSNGIKSYREMADNNSTIGAVLFLIDSFVRKVAWEVDAADDSDEAKAWAQFVEECVADISQSWANVMGEAVRGVCIYGWSTFEIVFKMRQGKKDDKEQSSIYNDNRIGWGKFAPRSQDTNYGWEFTETGELLGMYQMAPPNYRIDYIPLDKLLLFRSVGIMKDNPQGRSALRNCYISYSIQKKIQISEAIGISRNLSGLPVMTVPLRLLSDSATSAEKQLLSNFQDMVSRVKSDQYSGLVLPSEVTQDGNPSGYKFQLMTGASGKTAETTPVIERLEKAIARSFLADFLFLGSGTTGSWALSSSKTNMFSQALGGFLSAIVEVLNSAVEQLMRMNGNHDAATYPKIRHGDLEKMPLEEISGPIAQMVSAGIITPDDELEKWVREIAGAPQSENGFLSRPQEDPIEPTDDEQVGGE